MIRRMAVVSSALFAIAVAACDRPSAPDDSGLQKSTGGGTDTAGTGGPINPPPPPTNPVDTSGSSTYSGPVRLTVFVQQAAIRNTQGGADTLDVAPLAGARVEVEGILQLAQSAQSGMTGADGKFVVSDLPVGPYRVRITPPAGSGIAPVTGQAVLDRENVTMPFTLLRQ